MSEEACAWAQTTRAKNRSAKFVLMRLAAYADAKGVAWAYVSLLAGQIDGDDRTVQRALRALEKDGLIARTGRFHGRNVPFYQLDMDGAIRAALSAANGDNLSPLEGAATVTSEAPNGDTGATLKKGNNPPEGSEEPSSGAGARAPEADLCQMAFDAYPIEGRKGPSSIRLWRVSWASETAGGASGLAMLGAVRAYAGDRKAWGSSGRPKTAHVWLGDGCWEAFAPVDPVATAAAVTPPSAWSGPAEVRCLVEASGVRGALGLLDRSGWTGSAVAPPGLYSRDQLRLALKGTDITVLDPAPAGPLENGNRG